jgi:hypothetical protein
MYFVTGISSAYRYVMTSAANLHGRAQRMTPKDKTRFLWWLPAAPKSPDYSTQEAITLRAFERGDMGAKNRAIYVLLKTDGRVYRDFRAAVLRHAQGDRT